MNKPTTPDRGQAGAMGSSGGGNLSFTPRFKKAKAKEGASAASGVSPDTRMNIPPRGSVSLGYPSDTRMNIPPHKSVSADTSSRRSTQLNCKPCGGCCGRRFGPRVPDWFARLIRAASEALGKSVCEVVNEYGLCEVISEFQDGFDASSLDFDKRVEKFVSRVGVYKPGYLIVRVRDAPLDDAWLYVVLALHEEYVLNEVGRFMMGEGRLNVPSLRGFARHPFVVNLARELGFNDILELSRFLKALLDNGLVMVGGESMDEVRRVVCRLCDGEIPTLGRPSEYIRSIIGHFKSVHGLGTVEEVEAKARELADKGAPGVG